MSSEYEYDVTNNSSSTSSGYSSNDSRNNVRKASQPRSLQSLMSLLTTDNSSSHSIATNSLVLGRYGDNINNTNDVHDVYNGDDDVVDPSYVVVDAQHNDNHFYNHHDNDGVDGVDFIDGIDGIANEDGEQECMELNGSSVIVSVLDANIDVDTIFATASSSSTSTSMPLSSSFLSNTYINNRVDDRGFVDLASKSVSVFYDSQSVPGIMHLEDDDIATNHTSPSLNTNAATNSGNTSRGRSLASLLSVDTSTKSSPSMTSSLNAASKAEIDQLKSKIQSLENDSVELLAEIESLRGELTQRQLQEQQLMQQQQDQLLVYSTRLSHAEQERNHFQGQLEATMREMDDMKADMIQLQSEANSRDTKVDRQSNDVVTLRQELSTCKQELNRTKMELSRSKLDSDASLKELEILRDDIERSREQHAAAEILNGQQNAKIREIDAERRRFEDKLSNTLRELDQAVIQNNRLTDEIAAGERRYSQVDSELSVLRRRTATFDSLQHELSDLRRINADTVYQLRTAEDEVHRLRMQMANGVGVGGSMFAPLPPMIPDQLHSQTPLQRTSHHIVPVQEQIPSSSSRKFSAEPFPTTSSDPTTLPTSNSSSSLYNTSERPTGVKSLSDVLMKSSAGAPTISRYEPHPLAQRLNPAVNSAAPTGNIPQPPPRRQSLESSQSNRRQSLEPQSLAQSINLPEQSRVPVATAPALAPNVSNSGVVNASSNVQALRGLSSVASSPFATEMSSHTLFESFEKLDRQLTELMFEKQALHDEAERLHQRGGKTLKERTRLTQIETRMAELGKDIASTRKALSAKPN